jgi:hypothetical protein
VTGTVAAVAWTPFVGAAFTVQLSATPLKKR